MDYLKFLPENPQTYWTKELVIPYKGIDYKVTI